MIVAFFAFALAGIHAAQWENLVPWFGTMGQRARWPGVLQVFVTAPFWFSGFATVSQALGEQADSARRRALGPVFLVAIGSACLFYCSVVIAVSAALPRQELIGLELPAAGAFVRSLHSRFLADLVLGIGLIGLLIALNAIFFSAARVLFALARTGLLPERLGFLSQRTGSPAAAGTLVAVLSLIGTALGRGVITPLVDATSIILSCIYLMVCVAAIRVRKRRATGVPVIATLALLSTVAMLAVALFMSWRGASQQVPTDIVLLVIAALLGGAFRFWHRERSRGGRRSNGNPSAGV
jgi:amino acid transporter